LKEHMKHRFRPKWQNEDERKLKSRKRETTSQLLIIINIWNEQTKIRRFILVISDPISNHSFLFYQTCFDGRISLNCPSELLRKYK
jgi:hypothetical protein